MDVTGSMKSTVLSAEMSNNRQFLNPYQGNLEWGNILTSQK